MRSPFKFFAFIFAVAVFFTRAGSLFAGTTSPSHTFVIGTNAFLLDSQPFQIRCGEIHAARVPREYWRNRLQMAKAMGLNTVCAYLFWNEIEPQPGKFDWSDRADVMEFCRIAQEEGLWVILRPGPYSCAEWEMGGLPWWLLKNDGIEVRSSDPIYLAAATNYLREVAKQFGPLQITHGGPILMVQVENEYGFYGHDTNYITALKNTLQDSGIDVPLFQCNPPRVMTNGMLADLFQSANFGKDPQTNFRKLRELQPQGPLFCSEFYPGWFDTWGQPHHFGDTNRFFGDLAYMLSQGASFSIYMAHGGTTFGLWSGCDRPFKPDTSSYDYDAPLSEAGWPTEKFYETRALFSKYLKPGETLPPVPATNAVITFAPVEATRAAPIFKNLPKAIKDEAPQSMEKYDQGYGEILYRTRVPAGKAATLQAAAIHDFGFVFLNGRRIGILDRRSTNATLVLPARAKEAQLDILVEPMGRINFGPEMADHKGLIAPVTLDGATLTGWKIFRLPLDDRMLAHLDFSRATVPSNSPAFWRAIVKIKNPGDTFLDMHPWGKGVAWVNGHCLGRFWDIGPTQTMYVPVPWLKRGKNEFIILDLVGPQKPEVAGVSQPILDELHPEKDFTVIAKN